MTKLTEQLKPSKVEAHDIAEDVRETQRIAQAQEPGEKEGSFTAWIQRKKPR
jgi:hypothetical protein